MSRGGTTTTRRHGRPVGLGLALMLAAAPVREAAAADWPHARPFAVLALDYRFVPSRLVFRRGIPYRLRLDNRGEELHEFTARDFFASATLGNPQVLSADRTELAVAPGEHKDLYFLPRKPGRYRFICADHDWAGMIGEIIVE